MSIPRHTLTDAQYERIKELLPGKPADRGVTAKDNRLFVDAILFVQKPGILRYGFKNIPARNNPIRAITDLPLAHNIVQVFGTGINPMATKAGRLDNS